MLNLIASIQFPSGDNPLSSAILWFLELIYTGVGDYGLSLIIFTISIRVIILPLDFLNKYFTKRNAARTAEFKEEDDELKKQYGADPMKYMAARREMHRRNGHKPGPTMIIMVGNMLLTMALFITVFGCLNAVSTHNLNIQANELNAVYVRHETAGTLGTDAFRVELNETYDIHNSSFLWVHNIFRPDTPFATKNQGRGAFDAAVGNEVNSEARYDAIFGTGGLYSRNRSGPNGYLILVVLSAVTMFFSMQINMANQKKKKAAETQKQQEVGYSMRQAKAQTDPNAMPQIDPQKMMKYMKFMMPAMMIMFTFSSTAAFALYITIGALVQTTLGIGSNAIIGKLLKKQEDKRNADKPTHPVINPHSRYFKKKP
jgi:YidC/Oxa1 family membrane protein insertase